MDRGVETDFSRLEIGQVFPFAGTYYKVKEDSDDSAEVCGNCAFSRLDCTRFCCLSHERADGRRAVFAECDEAGTELYRPKEVSAAIRALIRRYDPSGRVSGHLLAKMAAAMRRYARRCAAESLKRAAEGCGNPAVADGDNIVLL